VASGVRGTAGHVIVVGPDRVQEVPVARPASPAARTLRRSGALLAVATLAANLLGYALVVVLTRVLPVGPLGAVGSLVNLSVIGAVPALAVQLVVARETARHLDAHGRDLRPLLRPVLTLSGLVGAALVVAGAALAPAAGGFLHLGGPLAPLLVAAALPAATVVFAVQGILQGAQRFGALSTVFVASAALRLAGGGIGGVVGGGPVGVVGGLLAGTLVAAGAALVLLGSAARRTGPGGPAHAAGAAGAAGAGGNAVPRPRGLLLAVGASTVSTSGLLVLLNVDVLLARHVLTPDESGLYAVGSLFTKAAFWGPAFVSTLLFARMSVGHARSRAVGLGVLLTSGLGAAAVAATALVAGPGVRAVAGRGYDGVAQHVWLFAALGATLAVAQVMLYARLAVGDQRLGAAAWLAGGGICAIVVGLVPAPGVDDVVRTALAGALLLGLAGLLAERTALLAWRRRGGPGGSRPGGADPSGSTTVRAPAAGS
jgi:O-antigen/teichoic acid export membrane protein